VRPVWRLDLARVCVPSPRGLAGRAAGRRGAGAAGPRHGAGREVGAASALENGADGEDGEDGDVDDDEWVAVGGLEGIPDDVEAEINVGGVPWGEVVLEAATEALGAVEGEVALHGLSIRASTSVVSAMLDHLTNRYGSPTMDELASFTRALDAKLEVLAASGAVPEDYTLEVSSPGADRKLRLPRDLVRFAELPLVVTYETPAGDGTPSRATEVLVLKDVPDEGATAWTWKVADVRANRPQGRALTAKVKKRDILTTLDQLVEVRIHVDL